MIVLYCHFSQCIWVSRWWQGLNISQGKRTVSAEAIRSPLEGVDLNAKSAQALAYNVDAIGRGRGRAGGAMVRTYLCFGSLFDVVVNSLAVCLYRCAGQVAEFRLHYTRKIIAFRQWVVLKGMV